MKDGEDDDPEYNYLEEEDQEYDKKDFKDDRAVKVSSKLLLYTPGNVSGYRCMSDCNSRGCEFDPGPVPYFCGD